MKLYGKAEEGIQTVLKARAAKEKVANTLADAGDNQTLVDQGAKINALCDELEGSMMPVGTTGSTVHTMLNYQLDAKTIKLYF